jgi:hypothetical protein
VGIRAEVGNGSAIAGKGAWLGKRGCVGALPVNVEAARGGSARAVRAAWHVSTCEYR